MARPFASSRRLRRASVSVAAGRSAQVGQAGEREVLARLRVRLAHAAGVPAEQRAGRDILQHGHFRERLHDLERAREAEPRDLVGPHARDVAALETHPTAGCRDARR